MHADQSQNAARECIEKKLQAFAPSVIQMFLHFLFLMKKRFDGILINI